MEFFAFRGDSKRSPKWLLIDEKNIPLTDFSAICDKLKLYLGNRTIIQRRWKEVDTPGEIQKLIYKLRKQERALLPWKKRRALDVAKKLLLKLYEATSANNISKKEKIKRVLDLLEVDFESETLIDYNHFAELWLFILLPALDEKRRKQKRKRTIVTLKDLTNKDILISEKELDDLYENCQYSYTLDELIASCIIGVQRNNIPIN